MSINSSSRPSSNVNGKSIVTKTENHKKTVCTLSYLCDVCDKTFSTHKAKVIHENFEHTDVIDNPVLLDDDEYHNTYVSKRKTNLSHEQVGPELGKTTRRSLSESESECEERSKTKDEYIGNKNSKSLRSIRKREAEAVLFVQLKPYVFKCAMCDECFSKPSKVVTHVRRVHYGERPSVCRYCCKSFYHANARNMHEHRVHGIQWTSESKRYKPYDGKNELSHSEELVADKLLEPAYDGLQCLKCSKKFHSAYHARIHVRRVHFMERKYECRNCKQSFGDKSDMSIHEFKCLRLKNQGKPKTLN